MEFGVSIDIKGETEVRARLTQMFDMKRLLPVSDESAKRLVKIFTQLTPISKDPDVDPQRGNLRKSWKGEAGMNPRANELLVFIRNLDPRARTVWPMLLFGTRPHVIKAKRFPFLTFTQRDRTTFVGTSVFHPGFRPKVDERRLAAQVNSEVTRLKRAITAILISGRSSTPTTNA
jgi:hypothetical protein